MIERPIGEGQLTPFANLKIIILLQNFFIGQSANGAIQHPKRIAVANNHNIFILVLRICFFQKIHHSPLNIVQAFAAGWRLGKTLHAVTEKFPVFGNRPAVKNTRVELFKPFIGYDFSAGNF